jgi:hypothetical protein
MNNFDAQAADIRRFLLRQLSEDEAAQIEEHIFADAAFAEEVNIVEEELITAYRANELSAQERAYFEQHYLASPAGRQAVEDEGVFSEFINSRLDKTELTPTTTSAPAVVAAAPVAPPRASWLARLRAFFANRPALAYSLLAGCLVLLGSGLWYLSGWNSTRSTADASLLTMRRQREQELAQLNKETDTPPGNVLTAVDLEPAQRGGGTMARVGKDSFAPDGLIQLRLNLPQPTTPPYRAVFRNDRGDELFVISNLPARRTPTGPQLWLYVHAGYFTYGDYRIDLSATGKGGDYEPLNSYAFRIVQAK